MQPIVVRPLSATPGQYELVADERRSRVSVFNLLRLLTLETDVSFGKN